MDSDLAWVNGKSGRQSWRYVDAFQRFIMGAIYHFTSRSPKLIDFSTSRNSIWDFLLVVLSALFQRDYSFCTPKVTSFHTQPLMPKCQGVAFGVDPWCWGSAQRRKSCRLIDHEIRRFTKTRSIPTCVTTISQLHRQTTCCSNKALCVAWRSKSKHFGSGKICNRCSDLEYITSEIQCWDKDNE